jgi:hypothetical protein
MADVIATGVALLLLYWWCLWFASCVYQNRLDRRQLHDPPTGGAWVRPRAFFDDLPH